MGNPIHIKPSDYVGKQVSDMPEPGRRTSRRKAAQKCLQFLADTDPEALEDGEDAKRRDADEEEAEVSDPGSDDEDIVYTREPVSHHYSAPAMSSVHQSAYGHGYPPQNTNPQVALQAAVLAAEAAGVPPPDMGLAAPPMATFMCQICLQQKVQPYTKLLLDTVVGPGEMPVTKEACQQCYDMHSPPVQQG
ncbi:unnamed protein product [Chrysoparadoxa australica]